MKYYHFQFIDDKDYTEAVKAKSARNAWKTLAKRVGESQSMTKQGFTLVDVEPIRTSKSARRFL